MSGAWSDRRLHFIGIGGAGMSGLALVCRTLGAEVGGSDRSESSYMERLRRAGIEPAVGHAAGNLPDDAEVIVSTAIGEDNPELALARERGLSVRHRGELLAELCAEKSLVAVAGTHGKTTTTAMIAWALRASGADPAFFVGGEVPGLGPEGEPANAGWGEGEWVVAEADESDASFLRLKPAVAVVTNIEMDHHSRWGSLSELTEAFSGFIEPADRVALPTQAHGRPGAPTTALADEAVAGRRVERFDERVPGPAELRLTVPGEHNARNARAAIAALGLLADDPAAAREAMERAAAGLADFPGVARRLERKGEFRGAELYDDYAHHPTEVRAALSALREGNPARLIAVFQPHLYSRTRALAEEFGAALAEADEVVVLDVYAAREEPVGVFAGVSGRLVAGAAFDRMRPRRVCWAPTLEQARGAVARLAGPGDVVVTIGAGDVFRVGEELAAEGSGR